MKSPSNKVTHRVMVSVILSTLLMAGCLSSNSRFVRSPFDRAPAMPADMTKAELVQHLNQNIQQLYSWRSTDIRISAREKGGIPVRLSAFLAVQTPRNLRLKVDSVVGTEVDLGSNSDRFWFWSKRNEPSYVLTASHEQTAIAQQRMQLPFEPDWLMEALGVIPIDESKLTMEHDVKRRRAKLIADIATAHGQRVRKVTIVDTRHGWIVEKTVHDQANRLIARAQFSKHSRIQHGENNSVFMPREIKMQWPGAGLTLTMHFDSFQINPEDMPDKTWKMQKYPNSPELDIGRR